MALTAWTLICIEDPAIGADVCEFCIKHGEGKIWYENASNYAYDLLSDLRRRRYIETFLSSAFSEGFEALGRLETIFRRKGRLPEAVKTSLLKKAREEHFGQVLPLEDITKLVNKASTIVRLPCACRWNISKKEERCCYAISYGQEAWYKEIDMSYFGRLPDEGLESIDPESAVRQMEEMERGGAVCNCSRTECLAMRSLSRIDVELMARAEYVARVDEGLCTGCGLCDSRCNFKAIQGINRSGRSVSLIDPARCFGCGLCRGVCSANAISLILR